jgi:MerR family transcriptional regulator, heat shock protein HspR
VSSDGRAGDRPARLRPELRFPGDAEPSYTVGQVAELLGVQPAFLRRLEAQGAVAPSRTAGNQRRYSRQEVERIDELTELIADGMTLAGATRIIALQAEVDELRRQLAAAQVGAQLGEGSQSWSAARSAAPASSTAGSAAGTTEPKPKKPWIMPS